MKPWFSMTFILAKFVHKSVQNRLCHSVTKESCFEYNSLMYTNVCCVCLYLSLFQVSIIHSSKCLSANQFQIRNPVKCSLWFFIPNQHSKKKPSIDIMGQSGFLRQWHLTHFCQIIWQIWSYTAQNKFRQKLSQVGFEPINLLIISLMTLPTELARNLLEISEVSFLLFHAPLGHVALCLFLESIEHDFTKALMIHTDNQIVT